MFLDLQNFFFCLIAIVLITCVVVIPSRTSDVWTIIYIPFLHFIFNDRCNLPIIQLLVVYEYPFGLLVNLCRSEIFIVDVYICKSAVQCVFRYGNRSRPNAAVSELDSNYKDQMVARSSSCLLTTDPLYSPEFSDAWSEVLLA